MRLKKRRQDFIIKRKRDYWSKKQVKAIICMFWLKGFMRKMRKRWKLRIWIWIYFVFKKLKVLKRNKKWSKVFLISLHRRINKRVVFLLIINLTFDFFGNFLEVFLFADFIFVWFLLWFFVFAFTLKHFKVDFIFSCFGNFSIFFKAVFFVFESFDENIRIIYGNFIRFFLRSCWRFDFKLFVNFIILCFVHFNFIWNLKVFLIFDFFWMKFRKVIKIFRSEQAKFYEDFS